jgi:hypothetical protein
MTLTHPDRTESQSFLSLGPDREGQPLPGLVLGLRSVACRDRGHGRILLMMVVTAIAGWREPWSVSPFDRGGRRCSPASFRVARPFPGGGPRPVRRPAAAVAQPLPRPASRPDQAGDGHGMPGAWSASLVPLPLQRMTTTDVDSNIAARCGRTMSGRRPVASASTRFSTWPFTAPSRAAITGHAACMAGVHGCQSREVRRVGVTAADPAGIRGALPQHPEG